MKQPPVSSSNNALGGDLPKIPPRPQRRIDRSASPNRFAGSPLNEPTFVAHKPSSLRIDNMDGASSDKPKRPPSVSNMPSVGQEGMEYAEICTPEPEGEAALQTRNIAEDLKLHAPKPSLSKSSATERIGTVTRTDSSQAAAFGIGKAKGDDTPDTSSKPQSLRARASFTGSHNGSERAAVPHDADDHQPDEGEVGQRVPMYPNAGLVQAPSHSPHTSQFAPGIGYHNDGSKRHHARRTSARGFEGPPGSYGMHGHGIIPKDKMEQAYYEKHPELWKKEVAAHGEDRKDWAMSSEDLNKIVRQTASRGSGLGTSPALVGTPTEQIGYAATEEYISRMSTPKQGVRHSKAPSNASDHPLQSPLRNETPSGLGEEANDDDVVHVDPPSRRISKIYGGPKHADSTENLGPEGGNTEEAGGLITERGYGVPILASDEVEKEPNGYELQPAVSPQHDNEYHQFRPSSTQNSRPSSRPGSIHGGHPSIAAVADFDREAHSTPLENVDEYEPLFPEDEDKNSLSHVKSHESTSSQRPSSKLKNRKFPSRDVWEDAPDSHMHTASVSTPQLPEESDVSTIKDDLNIHEGETAAQAFARRQEELAEAESFGKDSKSFLSAMPKGDSEKLKARNQRFPSKDIWEDSPESLQHETTVSGPQEEQEEASELSIPEERPTTGAVAFHQEKAAADIPLGKEEGRATTGVASFVKPSIPPRPKKPSGPKPTSPIGSQDDGPSGEKPLPAASSKPPVPMASKPPIPPRPVRKDSKNSATGEPLTQLTSASSARSIGSANSEAAAAKPKPPVPARPMGSKIAALQGGFMSQLNQRLQLGPQAPPKKEEPKPEDKPEEEKKPLADARKGRARGPARRAPAKAETKSKEASPSAAAKAQTLGFSTIVGWEIDSDDGGVVLVSGTSTPKSDNKPSEAEPKVEPAASEEPATTTALGSVLMTAKEVVEETAASASKAITGAVVPDESPESSTPVDTPVTDTPSETNAITATPANTEAEPAVPVQQESSSSLDTVKPEPSALDGASSTPPAETHDQPAEVAKPIAEKQEAAEAEPELRGEEGEKHDMPVEATEPVVVKQTEAEVVDEEVEERKHDHPAGVAEMVVQKQLGAEGVKVGDEEKEEKENKDVKVE